MTDLALPANWSDWLVVSGYLSFTLLVIWGVFRSSKPR